MGGKMREVADLEPLTSDHRGDVVDFGVADLEKFVEDAELVHQLEGGGMDGVTAEIAEEVLVLFEDGDGKAGASEEQAEHDSGRASADDACGLHDSLTIDAVTTPGFGRGV